MSHPHDIHDDDDENEEEDVEFWVIEMADDDERKTNPRADGDEGYDLELIVRR